MLCHKCLTSPVRALLRWLQNPQVTQFGQQDVKIVEIYYVESIVKLTDSMLYIGTILMISCHMMDWNSLCACVFAGKWLCVNKSEILMDVSSLK